MMPDSNVADRPSVQPTRKPQHLLLEIKARAKSAMTEAQSTSTTANSWHPEENPKYEFNDSDSPPSSQSDEESSFKWSFPSSTSASFMRRQVGHYLVLFFCLLATGFTFVASWSCNVFYGAEMPWFVGGGYGVWSLQDSQHQCQLWSVLFFAYQLDTPLRAARTTSMVTMLSSLALNAVVTQIIPYGRVGSWLVAIGILYWLADSILYWWRFNIWSTFFILTYAVFALCIRCFFLRKYSLETMWKWSRALFGICFFHSLGVFLILVSNVCTCENLSEEELEINGAFSPRPDDCSGECVLGPTSQTAIATPFLWLTGWILSHYLVGVKPGDLLEQGDELEVDFKKAVGSEGESATEKSRTVIDHSHDELSQGGQLHEKLDRKAILKPRPRLETSPTCPIFDEEEEEGRDDIDLNSICSQSCLSEASSRLEGNGSELDLYPGIDISGPSSLTEKQTSDEITPVDQWIRDQLVKKIKCHEHHYPRHYRVPPPAWCRRIEVMMLITVVVLYFSVVLVLMGSYFENRNAARAPNTSYNFITDVVCGFHPLDPRLPFETFDNTAQATASGYEVAHCGECGLCSNPSDVVKYVETRKTVADLAKRCSVQAILGKYEELVECLEHEIGFSRNCTTCWADNMRTTAKHCKWTCLSSMLIGLTKSNNVEDAEDYDWLNQCLFCDEKRSGPDFVTCSGVARRRLGIPSEIERNPKEQCPHVDVDYTIPGNLKDIFP